MKKILLVLFTSFLLSFLSSPVANAQSTTVTLSLDPDKSTKSVGQAFDVDLILNAPIGTYDISGFDITITFNKDIVQLESVDEADVFPSPLIKKIDNTAGMLRYARTNLTSKTIGGTLYLGTITFRAKKAGTSQVKITNAKITASRYTNSLPTNLGTGTYTISAVEGDINADGKVDILDYNIIVSCFGEKSESESCTDKDSADVNGDGEVNGVDYNIFLRTLRVNY